MNRAPSAPRGAPTGCLFSAYSVREIGIHSKPKVGVSSTRISNHFPEWFSLLPTPPDSPETRVPSGMTLPCKKSLTQEAGCAQAKMPGAGAKGVHSKAYH